MSGAGSGPLLPAEAPWLDAVALDRVLAIAEGYRQAFGRPLLPLAPRSSARQWAQALFVAPEVLLAHDGADPCQDPGPRLIYANRAALCLWRRPWSALVGMPSRLTAEPQERDARAAALDRARLRGGIRGYSGIRIDSQGRRFRLAGARIWSLIASDGRCCGQAAAFDDWYWL